MTVEVTVVDYGVGNLMSVRGALEYCGAAIKYCADPDELLKADRLLLPGVGAFGNSMEDMRSARLIEPVREFAQTGNPILGICLGFQMLFSSSTEYGHHEGLNLTEGEVVEIPSTSKDGAPHRIPHMGWNELTACNGDWSGTILGNVEPGASVYFAHSYMGQPRDTSLGLANSDYNGVTILAAVQMDNVHGCQFHPEKSGQVGLTVIENYLRL